MVADDHVSYVLASNLSFDLVCAAHLVAVVGAVVLMEVVKASLVCLCLHRLVHVVHRKPL